MANETEISLAAATTRLVSAFVSRQGAEGRELPAVLKSVADALASIDQPPPTPPRPAVNLRRLVRAEAIVCAECGRSGKLLSRHLRAEHGLSPEAYRAKWNLPHSHPMVAPSYSTRRSQLALAIGLGSHPRVARKKAAR